jgi:hypothetical protein
MSSAYLKPDTCWQHHAAEARGMTCSGSARALFPTPAISFLSASGASAARRAAPPRRLLATVALVALIGTGCSNEPAVIGSSGAGDGPATTGSPDAELKEKLSELARCMRENGVEDFPDPGADGSIQYYGDSPDFTSAQERCRDILPEDGNG